MARLAKAVAAWLSCGVSSTISMSQPVATGGNVENPVKMANGGCNQRRKRLLGGWRLKAISVEICQLSWLKAASNVMQ